MKFYAVSDLHLDIHSIRPDFWIDFDRDAVLVIAGDTANSLNGIAYIKNILCKHFRIVILIAGNHEWYTSKNKSYDESACIYSFPPKSRVNPNYQTVLKNSPLARLKTHANTTENLIFLDNEITTIDGFTIYGGTLWFPIHTYSHELIEKYALLMNDAKFVNYRIIEEQYKAFVNNFPQAVDLVISHHLPCRNAFASPQYAHSSYAPFYCANLSDELISRARFWIAGHQHDANETTISHTTIFICNPKGSIAMKPGLLKNIAYYL
ncbi:metallophosphoesterase [Vibrio cincinnatiensis]|uniref:metallophosphoesterase n=1 Tax=Vibrio cincinnatiensis TaxID=675 RepID=UPI001EE0C6F1|nr:metallophosphoesterase [Vibrio cincinnatiensis]MCG3723792.1 serine/threonine protein phosphatase [Vibrio cincinnatiensis]